MSAVEQASLPTGLVAASAGAILRDQEHPVSIVARTLGLGQQIVVRGSVIFWPSLPPDLSHPVARRAVLAHELWHVVQYRQGLTALRYLWRERGIYRYDHATLALGFAALGFEQQAALIEDYVRLLGGLGPRWGPADLTTAQLEPLLPF